MNNYPDNWTEIAKEIKDAAGWKCERCDHPHDQASGHVLTVHHLVPDKSLCEPWNLAALCQRCHLRIQGRVDMNQMYMFPHSKWLLPHLEGFMKWLRKRGTHDCS
jgi:hypothetical protein